MDEEERELTVDLYRALLGTLNDAAHMSRNHPSMKDAIRFGEQMGDRLYEKQFAKQSHNMLKEAKLVHIPPQVYADFHHEWDVRMCEEIGVEWRDPGRPSRDSKDVLLEEGKRTAAQTKRRMQAMPFPERLPFDPTYIVYGRGIGMTKMQMYYKTNMDIAKRMHDVSLIGMLLSSYGHCIEFFHGKDMASRNPNIPTLFNVVHSESGKWVGYEREANIDLTPAIANEVVEHISNAVEIRTPIKHSKRLRKSWRLQRKLVGVAKGEPPPDFYPYILRSSTNRGTSDCIVRLRSQATYRTDVIAHERLLVRRGEKPLSPKKHEYYIDNGFDVFIDEDPPLKTLRKMYVKGHELKGDDEWLAVKSVWIDEHMSNSDESLPYREKLTIARDK